MTITLQTNELVRILKEAALFAHSSPDIPVVNAVHVEARGGQLVADWPPTTELGPPLRGHGNAPHFCGKSDCGTNIPGKVDPFCGNRGPHKHFGSELAVSCMRMKGHDGNHSALVFSISEPQEWA